MIFIHKSSRQTAYQI